MDSSPMDHSLLPADIVFIMKIRFRILTAFEDMRSVCLFCEKDLQKDEETAKAEEMCSLLSVRLAITVL